jgi:hypothetical protein
MASKLTLSRFILSIALSIPLTTLPILFVTLLIVTAVSTREATASIRDERRSKLSPSVFFLIAFWAYILAPSWLPFCRACERERRDEWNMGSQSSRSEWRRNEKRGTREVIANGLY